MKKHCLFLIMLLATGSAAFAEKCKSSQECPLGQTCKNEKCQDCGIFAECPPTAYCEKNKCTYTSCTKDSACKKFILMCGKKKPYCKKESDEDEKEYCYCH